VIRPGPGGVAVFAPASVANFGVGFDALGAALDGPGDVVVARAVPSPGVRLVSISGDGGRLPLDPARNTAAVAAAAVLRELSARTGLELFLVKGLPLSSGLGSSAASAAAGALAAALVLGVSDRERLLTAVLEGEHAADGAWHGDNGFASLFGGIVLVPSSDPDRPEAVPLRFPARLRLVLVQPALELPTRRSRRALPRTVPLSVHVTHAAAFARLVTALSRGDLGAAGRSIDADRIVEPARAPLVPGHAAVTAAMRRAGALGCALAGAGPSLVALSEAGPAPERIARAAVRAWKREGILATARVHRVDTKGARRLRGVPA
jgi:homoserine kinase